MASPAIPAAPCSPARACRLRAWERAKAEQLIPYRNADGTWSVKTYTVTVTGAGWSGLSCNCPAGTNHRVCKHCAVVAKAIARHVSPVRGTAKVGKEVAAVAALTTAEVQRVAQALPNVYTAGALMRARGDTVSPLACGGKNDAINLHRGGTHPGSPG